MRRTNHLPQDASQGSETKRGDRKKIPSPIEHVFVITCHSCFTLLWRIPIATVRVGDHADREHLVAVFQLLEDVLAFGLLLLLEAPRCCLPLVLLRELPVHAVHPLNNVPRRRGVEEGSGVVGQLQPSNGPAERCLTSLVV